MPDISVIMGIYNGSRTYAAMAIDSVLNQTYTGFEYIICDDGSENTFYEWLEAYCKKTTESDFYEIIGIGDLRIRLTAV